MRRREFITLLGGAATWPLAARGQQAAMPVIGLLGGGSPESFAFLLPSLRQGLQEAGVVEGRTTVIEPRWARGESDRLPGLAADLVERRAAVIVTQTLPAALAAKAATTTIPIVFGATVDPVKQGLVASLNRPGGNATGVNFFTAELVAKRMQLLREVVPTAHRIALLVNPTDAENYQSTLREAEAAAGGQQVIVRDVATGREIDQAFANITNVKADALFVAPGSFFNTRRVQLAVLAARHGLPAIYAARAYAEAGGLISYGTDILDAFRQVGAYSARILKGAKPADLPVLQSTKFELVINLNTVRALGLEIPSTLLARADEVIE
jgi:putative ABC transport system substrate-binding protein